MKKVKLLPSLKATALIVCIHLSFSSCVNDIDSEDTGTGNPVSYPVTLSTKIQRNNSSVSEKNFRENDKIGLFVLTNSSQLDEKRYIDNLKFVYSEDDGFVPEKELFFPEDASNCDFISYFPYQASGIVYDDTTMPIQVSSDQSKFDAYNESDFMTAISYQVPVSQKAVNLTFRHKLYNLNIILKPESGFSAEDLLDMQPDIIIKDVCTRAIYDFGKDDINSTNSISDVIPYGNWRIENDLLIGKTAILIPQELNEEHLFIEIRTNSGDFHYTTPEKFELEKEQAFDIIITLKPGEQTLDCTLRTSIEGWGEPGQKEVEADIISTSIELGTLTFANSNVYQVISKGKKVAEICKEYLLSDDIDSEAIVIYPCKNGKTDLENGKVCHLIDEFKPVHGSTISWYVFGNSFTYQGGTSGPITRIYISREGTIETIRPADAIPLQVKPETITDTRGTETIVYPIVKIGTQYWMRSNLKSEKYTDGSSIKLSNDSKDTSPSLFKVISYYFYNSAAISTGLLSPEGWRVGNNSDWQRLKNYIKSDASVLKNGNWERPKTPVTNYSGFNGVPTGYFENKTHTAQKLKVGYWRTEVNNSSSTNGYILLDTNNNEMKMMTNSYAIGLAIRCIRE